MVKPPPIERDVIADEQASAAITMAFVTPGVRLPAARLVAEVATAVVACVPQKDVGPQPESARKATEGARLGVVTVTVWPDPTLGEAAKKKTSRAVPLGCGRPTSYQTLVLLSAMSDPKSTASANVATAVRSAVAPVVVTPAVVAVFVAFEAIAWATIVIAI
jgi:hypothetical protein